MRWIPIAAAVLALAPARGTGSPDARNPPGAPDARNPPGAPDAQSSPGAGRVVRVEHRDPAALPTRGPTHALVTIELFFAPGATSRVEQYRHVEKLQAQHPSRIRIVYRVIKYGASARLPLAALQAHAEGKFFEFMEVLNAQTRAALTDKELLELGKKVGLDADRLHTAVTKPPATYERLLEANERRRRQRIRGSPAPPNALFNGRVPMTHLSAMGASDLVREYREARELAEDLLDRGVEPRALSAAFDQIPPELPEEILVQPGELDDQLAAEAPDGLLVSPPLDVRGLPTYGSAEAASTVVVACSPTSSNCSQPMRAARIVQEMFPDRVRVVWAPLFDVGRDDAADLSLLADAALCAERIGVTLERAEDFGGDASPGWRWVEAVIAEANARGRRTAPDKIIDKIGDKLRVPAGPFATCRAQLAGASIAWIEAARRAGIRVTPSTVVGGRAYGPIHDLSTLQLLVETELAPGWLAPAWTRPQPKASDPR